MDICDTSGMYKVERLGMEMCHMIATNTGIKHRGVYFTTFSEGGSALDKK